MKAENIIKIIKEEIEGGGYNYLNLDKLNEESANIELLKSKDFQIQFVEDVLNNFQSKVKIIGVNVLQTTEDQVFNSIDNDSTLNLDYDVEIRYDYLGKVITFSLKFDGRNISYSTGGYVEKGNRENPSTSDKYFTYFNWKDINVILYDENGIEVSLNWLKNNDKIHENFIRKFIQDVLEHSFKKY